MANHSKQLANIPGGAESQLTPGYLFPASCSDNRQQRIVSELRVAIAGTSGKQMAAWGGRSGRHLVGSGLRRAGNLWSLAKNVGDAAANEVRYVKDSSCTSEYALTRANTAVSQWNAVKLASVSAWQNLHAYSRKNPAEAATRLVLLCFGFSIGSGGLDGDGGIPDTDWSLMGTHRSIFTHSIIAGMVVEVAVAALVDLISTIHGNLPEDHDPVWDSIKAGSSSLNMFALGASAGIAYHLGIDATIDGDGRYVDLPFSTTQETHQAIAAVNAITEGLDAVSRQCKWGDTVATYGNLDSAREAVVATERSTSYVIQRLRNDGGFRVTWRPSQTLRR